MDRDAKHEQHKSAGMSVTLADYIYPAIQKEYVNIIAAEADVLAEGGVESIHQMRVSLRRLRSHVRSFSSQIDIPQVMGDKQVGKIARSLGKVRDLDVLKANLKKHRSAEGMPKSERGQLEKVADSIDKRRDRGIVKVRQMFDGQDYQFFKLGLNNWLNHPQYQFGAEIECAAILPELMLSVTCKVLIHPGWWIDLALDDSPKATLRERSSPEALLSHLLDTHNDCLHDLRKQVKAVRYLMEIFPDCYPPEYRDYLKEFKQIHQIFGDIQDNIVLDEFIRKVLGKHAASDIPTVYERLVHQNYLHWQNWQPIRDRYRQAAAKRDFQLLLLGKI